MNIERSPHLNESNNEGIALVAVNATELAIVIRSPSICCGNIVHDEFVDCCQFVKTFDIHQTVSIFSIDKNLNLELRGLLLQVFRGSNEDLPDNDGSQRRIRSSFELLLPLDLERLWERKYPKCHLDCGSSKGQYKRSML